MGGAILGRVWKGAALPQGYGGVLQAPPSETGAEPQKPTLFVLKDFKNHAKKNGSQVAFYGLK